MFYAFRRLASLTVAWRNGEASPPHEAAPEQWTQNVSFEAAPMKQLKEQKRHSKAYRKQAVRLLMTRWQSAEVLDTLAAAYAETARSEDAIKAATEARTVALAGKDAATAAVLAQHLKSYQAGNRYRDEP
jgi:hypothetical protein